MQAFQAIKSMVQKESELSMFERSQELDLTHKLTEEVRKEDFDLEHLRLIL